MGCFMRIVLTPNPEVPPAGSQLLSSTRPHTPSSDFRPSSRQNDRRPLGPRSPSPLPPARSPSTRSLVLNQLASESEQSESEGDRSDYDRRPVRRSSGSKASGIPLRQKQPLRQTSSASAVDATPRASTSNPNSSMASSIEPLSIKKKTSTRSSTAPPNAFPSTPTPARRMVAKNSPLNKAKGPSPKKVSPQLKKVKAPSLNNPVKLESLDNLMRTASSAKDNVSDVVYQRFSVADQRGRSSRPSVL